MKDNYILLLTIDILLEKIKNEKKFDYQDYKATEIVLKKSINILLEDEYVKFKKELVNNECKKHK